MMSGELQAAFEHRINHGTRYMGIETRKQPVDAWVYQEIIHELKPDWIVEVGNHHGGTLLYLAHLCDLIGHGTVLGVDNDRTFFEEVVWKHPRVRFITDDAIVGYPDAAELVNDGSCLVIEDSAHTYQHTLAVLETYGQLVQAGGYLICEDGVMAEVARALEDFVAGTDRFEVDRSREWPITWNPGGYLRRVA